jgi:transposase InsO family protein
VPNSLWQMDFKGPVNTLAGQAHPLTVLDDHSRFNLCLQALPNQQTAGVQDTLSDTFRRYGLPDRMAVDNGSPWGCDAEHLYTALTVWLIRLGVSVSHSRPYHPQTLGKDERFHGTLKRELLNRRQWQDRSDLQKSLDPWREEYNWIRPHEAWDWRFPARGISRACAASQRSLSHCSIPTLCMCVKFNKQERSLCTGALCG